MFLYFRKISRKIKRIYTHGCEIFNQGKHRLTNRGSRFYLKNVGSTDREKRSRRSVDLKTPIISFYVQGRVQHKSGRMQDEASNRGGMWNTRYVKGEMWDEKGRRDRDMTRIFEI